MAHAEAVAADVDDVTVMDQAIDQRVGHRFIAEDLAPLLETLVAREDGARPLVAFRKELEEQNRAGFRDGFAVCCQGAGAGMPDVAVILGENRGASSVRQGTPGICLRFANS
jgi:hypothetical protein